MGQYWTQQGAVVYPNEEMFREVLAELEEEGWVEDGFFVDEDGKRLSGVPTISEADLAITLPLGVYRNLTSDMLFPPGTDAFGILYRTTTDGEFTGEHVIDGTVVRYDLTAWAAEMMPDEDTRPPAQHHLQSYEDWRDRVILAFHAGYGVPIGSAGVDG